mmetsp:Transcript_4844/g.7332  ORF Transcript_4844/g.7332 Transcript_4844/m.7332 type:complete len:93 (-) Transcript_4844:51-329(-)|eukprot:CAMPEP_0203747342 /NCGR_PEP_ID=MMETSP0098-20131031/2523_1 /ASSEMBLY_ACC=CAM_ASM_000208 /TAXON_ID=96639 /ORGANISM=" , Strain NY0313808BC1" /LENGTH=92 /DNA_ID=CAMNT_0050635741 /DNA_START=231 /DNA_END=509 /DNA_ORIENTATION=-
MPRAKDPKQPKRPLSAFMFFSKENRPIVIAENEGISFGAIGKKLGEKWRGMSDSDKKPYAKLHAEDKKRFEREMQAYTPPEPTNSTSRRSAS